MTIATVRFLVAVAPRGAYAENQTNRSEGREHDVRGASIAVPPRTP
jgi:hypothetical protein